ncbi:MULTISPECIES: peptidylprolyl isomerase [unclassified Meiothermus]|uniref:peptidylprolyl isomerase n=1 Tax=unclassified Meiothermus TaxID=370471 RepID=UPI000D7C942A|nr:MULTISPECIES: peptidylprolyl isomerase [unclassified Meiothermus]PZA06964.1 peptidylprolyl isomerase [Meiothermus sp. Pnk-1]RYM38353.1 peptidylprolyl isomerase [Meiothermus sp. PNK-Is4]
MPRFLICLLALFSLSLAQQTSPQQDDPVVAEVGGQALRKSYFDLEWGFFVKTSLQRQGVPATPETESQFERFKPQFLERLAQDYAVIKAAERAGLAASKEAVEDQVAEARKDFESDEAFGQALNQVGLASLDDYRMLVYEALTYNAYLERLQGQIQPSESALRLIYGLSQAEFTTPETYCASHILVVSGQEAISLIRQLGQGADFAELAKRYSQDPGSKDNGGDLGCEPRGTYVTAFENAMLRLKVGQTSREPVRTEFGFHVIRLNKIEPSTVRPFDEVKSSIADAVLQQAVEKLLNRIGQRAGITLYPERLGLSAQP